VRENFAGPGKETKVVVNMPQGLGRYGIEDADHVAENGSARTFEWFLKNHLGSTMLVYGTGGTSGGLKAAYDYRSFGEQIELTSPSTGKVTENFTGKEKDDETELNYFGARYLDPMLGMWTSVDPARQFASPYLYAGNGYNPINSFDPDGDKNIKLAIYYNQDETGAEFDAEKMAAEYKEYISSRIDMSVNTVEVKAFAAGSTTDLEMTSWLNLGQPDLPAIITHGGKGAEFISDVPKVTEESRIDFKTLDDRLTTKTYLGACFAKENLEAANGKYDKLYGPKKYGITYISTTLDYLIKNADVAPKKDQE
jgi:RHS repeat-associated protein